MRVRHGTGRAVRDADLQLTMEDRNERIKDVVANLIEELPSPGSRRAYEADWVRFTAWLKTEGVDVLDVKPRHISSHLNVLRQQGKKKSTLGRALSVLREMYAALVRDELMESNPAREVKNVRMSADPKTPVLTEDEVRRLMAATDDTWTGRRDRLCLLFLFGLGLRRAEVARLHVHDLSNHTATAIVKGGKELTVGLPAWLTDEIDAWRTFAGITEGALLPRSERNRSAVSGDIVYSIVKSAAQRAGLPLDKVTPHALRRTYITLGGERGIPLKARQLSVGHVSQATTERYDKARDAAKTAPGQVFEDLIRREKLLDDEKGEGSVD